MKEIFSYVYQISEDKYKEFIIRLLASVVLERLYLQLENKSSCIKNKSVPGKEPIYFLP